MAQAVAKQEEVVLIELFSTFHSTLSNFAFIKTLVAWARPILQDLFNLILILTTATKTLTMAQRESDVERHHKDSDKQIRHSEAHYK